MMDEKNFFEVFPSLKLKKELKTAFDDAMVTHISMNSSKTVIKIYLIFNRLVGRDIVAQVEDEISRQMKPFLATKVVILEKFRLSELYTSEIIFNDYKDSIIYELGKNNKLYEQIFRDARWSFDGEENIKLIVADNFVSRKKTPELVEILTEMMECRFGKNITYNVVYEEREESRHSREAEYKVQRIIDEIAARGAAKTEKTEAAPAETPAEKNEKEAETKQEKKEFKKEYIRPVKHSDNPDVIYGRDFNDEPVTLDTVIHEMGEITFRGQIIFTDKKELRNGKIILIFDVTDFTDTISVKLFLQPEQLSEVEDELKKGKFIKIKGVTTVDKFSGELTIGSVVGIIKIDDFRKKRMDYAMEKRVELHLHTKMSDLDGVSDIKDIIRQAMSWGHNAIAITDHGDVQAFTDAYHMLRDSGNKDFKVIYGVEAYIVDDLRKIIFDSKGQKFDDTYVVFDLETTGLSPVNDSIIEIGAVKIQNKKVVDRFSTFVNPKIPIPYNIEQLTGIDDSMVVDADTIENILPEFLKFCDGAVMVAHNAEFDVTFIREKTKTILRKAFECTVVDTVSLARALIPNLGKFTLDHVAKALNVSLLHHHRAVDDAECCADIFLALVARLEMRNIFNLDEINEIEEFNINAIKKAKTYHAIILADSEVGRVNLYRLISLSHLTYFNRRPRIPKSEVEKYRDGLILGSACEAGELYQAILNGNTEEEIARLANYYDYLEIQPVGNNRFMIESQRLPQIKSEQDIIDINKKIVALGEKFNKPVVATCDVHFLNPEDEVYRRIIMKGQGFDDADNQAPLFLRTTEEMLEEFKYLGEDKAYEVVVTNTRLIADLCEYIEPVRPDKCPPVIPNCDQTLRDICYNRAHEMYGPKLPEIVESRLEKELNSIISNGYSVMYIIAQKLVWKSNEDGYLVGSRGSVGSSFVATMSGVTEVNPLSPHYLCPECYYVDFDSDEVRKFAGGAGCDMPDKICPKCGAKLKKEGFDIPFETFLGFNGDKEPDIDLNFSGEYQAKAHAYVEVIFGEGQTYKAGTVGTLADKTVYGYVKKYYEEKGERKRSCEINRIVNGGVGVKRSTGQHPGGIIVLPYGEEIHSFTPIQHPANDMTTNIVTTHFDYHSIDHNLLKLDILGHDDPTMIRMLQDLTKLDPTHIPLDSPEVMSLFQSTEALKINPEDIGGTKLGCLGIPEFGTDFAMQMLIDTNPQHFSDLVRIAGLSHGTDVWLGNAQTLIEEGKATISTAICTRDDIMIYLINMGIEAGTSFKIMESVRKGKGLKPEWEELMVNAGVPDWYIWSCKKIKYMFPKAHAAAYVMMAWRIAYCKVFYPLEYYASYFSIRADDFSYRIMCFGKDKLDEYIEDYKRRNDSLTNKEQGQLKDMRIVQEMYARGFDFMPIDLYKSHSRNFQIVDGKLLPPFKSIDGLGETAADSIYEAAKCGKFLSVEDFIDKAKVPKTSAAVMVELGILKGMSANNQLSLFDYM